MLSRDRGAFDLLIDTLHRHFPEREITPELRRDYWEGLKDLDFKTVRTYADRHIESDKFFPRLSQLRPQPRSRRAPDAEDSDRNRRESMDKSSALTWDEYLRTDPDEARIQLTKAKCARILVTNHESSPQYAEALAEYGAAQRRLLDLWYARAEQRKAAKKGRAA